MNTLNNKPVIMIQAGLLTMPVIWSTLFNQKQQSVLIVTDTRVASVYLQNCVHTLEQIPAIMRIDHIIIEQGDAQKSLDTAQKILTHLIEQHHYRDTTLIALGGGMIGHLTGFCAACYLRGVDYIQIPTSLLAQVDASIGGKTSVNHPLGKNLIGFFYQPKAILCDTALLDSLTQAEFIAGLSEVIKYGLTLDPEFFVWIENNVDKIIKREPNTIEYIVSRAIQLKMGIVIKDERDTKERAFLNFGHTVAHALEAQSAFKSLSHGQAVSIGLMAALKLSHRICGLDFNIIARLEQLLNYIGLPVRIPNTANIDELIEFMKMDKKNRTSGLQWVLLEKLGKPVIITGIAMETVHSIVS